LAKVHHIDFQQNAGYLMTMSVSKTYSVDDTMINECGAVGGGTRIGRENRRTRKKPSPVPLRPPQIPHDLTQDRNWGEASGKSPELWYSPKVFMRYMDNSIYGPI
jgi:hypothetical protein